MAPNQSCMPLVVKKNGNMWETFPTEGGGHLFPTQLFSLGPELWFFGEDQKCSWGSKMKNKPNFFFDNRGFPNLGGGGSALWEFFPHNPFFSACVPKPLHKMQKRNSVSWNFHLAGAKRQDVVGWKGTVAPRTWFWDIFGLDKNKKSFWSHPMYI